MKQTTQILCVDDEKNVLKSLQRLFMDEDYDILIAESGQEGLEALTRNPEVQVVISDYRMPGMTGVDFLHEVSKQWPNTVRIILSGFADTAAIVSAINEGQVYRFVAKPWNDDDLKHTIRLALDHYELQRRNELLLQELKKSNQNLKSVNENLELLVHERTANLTLHNQALQIAQNILDAMPAAVLGIDSGNMVVYANRIGHKLFSPNTSFLLGVPLDEVLPQKLLPLVGKAAQGTVVSEVTPIGGRLVRVMGSKLKAGDQEGVILIAIPERS
jgi:two-component system NtrC family sensor kinase